MVRPAHAAPANPADDVMLDLLATWLAGALSLPAAEALATRAHARGEHESAYEILELCARSTIAPHAREHARAVAKSQPNLPRFIAGTALPCG